MYDVTSSSTHSPVKTFKSQETHVWHHVQITTICLNGDNFLRWSQSIHMYIRGQGKIGYLTGDKETPAKEDPMYAT